MNRPGLTRRQMMKSTAGVVAGFSFSALSPRMTSWAAEMKSAGFRIGACDWTLGKRADPSSLEFAKQLGLDGVQVDFGGPEEGLPLRRPEVQRQFLEAAKLHGMEIGSLAIGALNNVPYKNDSRAEEWVSDAVDVCSAMGLKVILLAFFSEGDLRDDKVGTDITVERLKNVAPKAEKAGVVLGIESWLDAKQHMDILERVGSPAVKVYYDVGNSHHVGYDIYEEIRFLGDNICEFHAKDYEDLYGKGTIDFPKVRKAMDDIGYRGWLQIEGVKMPLGLEESVRYDAQYLREIFPREV